MYTNIDIETLAKILVEEINKELDEGEFLLDDAIAGIKKIIELGIMTYEELKEEIEYDPDNVFGWIVGGDLE